MLLRAWLLSIVILATATSRAQSSSCDFHFPALEQRPRATAADAAEPFPGGGVFLAAPPLLDVPMPRNVEVRLGGTLSDLTNGFWQVTLTQGGRALDWSLDGNRVVVDGGFVRGPLAISLGPTEANPCGGCFGVTDVVVLIDDVVDTAPPVLDDVFVQDLVPPDAVEQQRCNVFFGAGDALFAVWTPSEFASVSLFASAATVPPRLLLDNLMSVPAQRGAVQLSLSAEGRVAPGDDVVVALVARDLAGNSSAHIRHVRARPFSNVADADTPIDELPGGQCVVDAAPRVRVPARVPANPSLRVSFPFEPVPLALIRDDDGSSVPLVPGDDLVDDGLVEGGAFAPARALSPGAWRLVSLPCDRCVCRGCTAPVEASFVVDDVVDTTPPAPPVVSGFIDDPQPIPSSPDCAAPHAGTLVALAPGVDDVSGPFDLTYDAVLRLGDDPPRVVGRGLLPLARADGSVVVRLPTSSLGRIIDAAFTLELTARDAAGNASSTTFHNAGRSLEVGCGQAASVSTTVMTSTTSLALLALLLRRRRRR